MLSLISPAKSLDLTSPVPVRDYSTPRLLEESERRWLEEALRRYPKLTRAQLASKLKISESLLYKKLRQHGIYPER